MSSFGYLSVSGIDGVTGSGGSGGSTLPGGIDKSVQFNDGGLVFGGVSSFLFDKTTSTLSVTKTKPTQIIDSTNSVGTAGQVLSSTGSTLQYITPAVTAPGGFSSYVQFNQGGTFAGDNNLLFDNTPGVKQLTVTKIKPATLVDSSNSIGTAGQVLSSTGSALQYITLPVNYLNQGASIVSNLNVVTINPGDLYPFNVFFGGVSSPYYDTSTLIATITTPGRYQFLITVDVISGSGSGGMRLERQFDGFAPWVTIQQASILSINTGKNRIEFVVPVLSVQRFRLIHTGIAYSVDMGALTSSYCIDRIA